MQESRHGQTAEDNQTTSSNEQKCSNDALTLTLGGSSARVGPCCMRCLVSWTAATASSLQSWGDPSSRSTLLSSVFDRSAREGTQFDSFLHPTGLHKTIDRYCKKYILHDCVFKPSIPQANSPVGYEQGCIDDRLVIYAQSAQIVVQCMANKDHIVFEQALQRQLSIPAPVCHTLQGAPHGSDENKTATYRQFPWHMWISSTLQWHYCSNVK
jgi:hypothetical protein